MGSVRTKIKVLLLFLSLVCFGTTLFCDTKEQQIQANLAGWGFYLVAVVLNRDTIKRERRI